MRRVQSKKINKAAALAVRRDGRSTIWTDDSGQRHNDLRQAKRALKRALKCK